MRPSELDRLMTAALDGEATPDEAAALERALAGDPALRERYAAWRRLFDALDRVPAPHPPEGLVAAVMANIPAAGRPADDQLTSPSPVFGVGSNPFSLGGTMSEQTSGSFNKRKLVLAVGLAAIAVVVVAGYTLDMPPGSKDTIGTILPAERFIKPQATAVDVPQGAPRPSGTPLVPPSADAAAATADAKAQATTQGKALSQTRDQAEAKPQAQTMGQTRDQAEAKPQAQTMGQTRDQAEAKPQAKTMGQTRSEAEAKPQGQTLGSALSQTQGQAHSTAQSQAAGQAKVTAEGKALGQTAGTTQSQAASTAHSQTAGQAKVTAQGTAHSQTAGQAKSTTQGTAHGQTAGTAHSQAASQAASTAQGTALGTTQGTALGTAK